MDNSILFLLREHAKVEVVICPMCNGLGYSESRLDDGRTKLNFCWSCNGLGRGISINGSKVYPLDDEVINKEFHIYDEEKYKQAVANYAKQKLRSE